MNKRRFAQRNKVAQTPKYWVRLTRLCNNNCVFCLDKEAQDGTYVPLQDIENQLKQGRKQGIKKLILSGGEPTLHSDYLEIVAFGRNIGYDGIQIVTNGRMFAYKGFLEQAVANGLTETTFSIHGHTKALYEKQTQIKDSYEQAMRGLLNALKNKKLIVNIDIVINRINYRYLEEIIRFFIGLGVGEFDLLHVVPFGNAWKNKKDVFYNLDSASPYLEKAFSLQFEFPDIYIWTNRFPAQYLEGFEELMQHPIKLYDEIRGRRQMFENFLERDKMMPCFGGQCRYCFLERFCADLIELKEKRTIITKELAFCLTSDRQPLARFKVNADIEVAEFLGFYIKYRYFIKSLRCRYCKCFDRCDGAPINLIREKGFRILKPIN